MKGKFLSKKGITLVALIITVIVMLILSGVAISVIVDGDGLFSRTRDAAEEYKNVSDKEAEQIQSLTNKIDKYLGSASVNPEDGSEENEDKPGEDEEVIEPVEPILANAPILLTGMKAVTFNADGTTKKVEAGEEWYDYDKKQWANAETEDGSLWVWIPRFAYQITYKEPDNKSAGGNIDVVFLEGITNNYAGKNSKGINVSGTASETHDATTYTLHPSFNKAINGDYSHGEWNEELTGYWVAKFQAGWQEGNALSTNNDKTKVVQSAVSFEDPVNTRYIVNIDGDTDATNDKITYPVFKGATYIMDYISIADSFAICRHLTDTYIEEGTSKNFYGISSVDADSHLMKSSEWGACAYLGYSQYGTEGEEVYINNVYIADETNYINSVTGFAGNTVGEEETNDITDTTKTHIWYSSKGQLASNNHNITGVYDMSGATYERVAAYIAVGGGVLVGAGTVSEEEEDKLIATTEKSNDVTKLSTQYSTVYKYGETNNGGGTYNANIDMYGDATVETSNQGTETTSWNSDNSYHCYSERPFSVRGSVASDAVNVTGTFAYNRNNGYGMALQGFRAVICPI